MIDLYTWKTPNGYKIPIMLEECQLQYKIIPVNISTGAQSEPEFLKINPNGKIPAIIDHDDNGPITIFESGAILMYLAEKTKKFLPTDIRNRFKVMEWLMFQVSGAGPMFGQMNHFTKYAPEQIPYAIERYTKESRRLLTVIDQQLTDNQYIAGDYSIADMALFPWVNAMQILLAKETEELKNIARWLDSLNNRDAIKRAMAIVI